MTQRSLGPRTKFHFNASAGMSVNTMGRSGFIEHEALDRATSGPFVFKQSEDYLKRNQFLDQRQQRLMDHQDRVAVTDEDVIREIYSPQNEINSNCSLQVLGGHQPSIKLARDLLMIYGDSFTAGSADDIIGYYQTPSQQVQAILDP